MFQKYLPENSIEILDKLRSILIDYGFYLAGGTALALQIGHRYSRDLDFFTQRNFNTEILTNKLLRKELKIRLIEEGTILSELQNTSVSFFYCPYPLIFNTVDFTGIQVAQVNDIATMKLIAIAQRAEKKDYFDIAEVLKRIPPKELKETTIKKYGKSRLNWYHIVKSLFFFSDVEDSPDPMYSDETWDKVKKFLLSKKDEIETVFLNVEDLK
jgi:predicted nucleotidyltransferase component of viral defense system